MKVSQQKKHRQQSDHIHRHMLITEFFIHPDSLELILRQEILAEIQSKSRLSGLARM